MTQSARAPTHHAWRASIRRRVMRLRLDIAAFMKRNTDLVTSGRLEGVEPAGRASPTPRRGAPAFRTDSGQPANPRRRGPVRARGDSRLGGARFVVKAADAHAAAPRLHLGIERQGLLDQHVSPRSNAAAKRKPRRSKSAKSSACARLTYAAGNAGRVGARSARSPLTSVVAGREQTPCREAR